MKSTDKGKEDDKQQVRLPTFCVIEAEKPSALLLWILHFAHQVNSRGFVHPWMACNKYFTCCVTSKVQATFQDSYEQLPQEMPLNEGTFKSLVAQLFAKWLTPSEVMQFQLYLAAGPQKLPNMSVDQHHQALLTLSRGILYIDNNTASLTEAGLKFAFYKGCPKQGCELFCNANPLATDPTTGHTICNLIQVMQNYECISQDCIATHQEAQRTASSSTSCCHP